MKHISTNKYEYNIRQIDLLSEQIIKKENELKAAINFLQKFRLKGELKKLYKAIESYGNEAWHYEVKNASERSY